MEWGLGLRAATWLTLCFSGLAWLLALNGVYGMQSVLAQAKLVQVRLLALVRGAASQYGRRCKQTPSLFD